MTEPRDPGPCAELLDHLRRVVSRMEATGLWDADAAAAIELWAMSADWPSDDSLSDAQALLVRVRLLRGAARSGPTPQREGHG